MKLTTVIQVKGHSISFVFNKLSLVIYCQTLNDLFLWLPLPFNFCFEVEVNLRPSVGQCVLVSGSCLETSVFCQSQSHFSTNSQSVNTSWCQAHSWAFDQKFVFVWCFY
jgi:hypothetical protein